ncbi:MAG: hypothetical protein V1709_10980 [Planctomycetota bacterium]
MASKIRDDDFFNFQAKLVNEVVTNAVAWTIPPAEVARETGYYNSY